MMAWITEHLLELLLSLISAGVIAGFKVIAGRLKKLRDQFVGCSQRTVDRLGNRALRCVCRFFAQIAQQMKHLNIQRNTFLFTNCKYRLFFEQSDYNTTFFVCKVFFDFSE